MLTLAKNHAVLTVDGESGWGAVGGGIAFHFKDGISVFISDEMALKIHQTFKHQMEEERKKDIPALPLQSHQAGKICANPSECSTVRCMNAAEMLGLPVKGVDHE